MVWQVVTAYARSGVTYLASFLSSSISQSIEVFPDSTSNWLRVRTIHKVTPISPLCILNLRRRGICEVTQYAVYVGNLPWGMCIAKVGEAKTIGLHISASAAHSAV